MKFPTSIKSRITIMTIAVTLFITVLVSSVCFYTFQTLFTKGLIQSTEFSLQTSMSALDKSLLELTNFAEWGNINSTINRFLTSSYDPQKKIAAYNRMYEQYLTNYSTAYINRVMIGGMNGNFIQEVKKTFESSSHDYEMLTQSSFFQEILSQEDYERMELVVDPLKGFDFILPILRPIYSSFSSDRIGWIFLSVSSDLFRNTFLNYPLPEDSFLILTIGNTHYRYEANDLVEFAPSYQIKKDIPAYTLSDHTSVHMITDEMGESLTIVSYSSIFPDLVISQSLSDREFAAQKRVYYKLMLIAGCIIFTLGIWLVFYLNHIISNPISSIIQKLNAISRGDFSPDPSIEWNHEFGEIGKGINQLSSDVVVLMNKRIENEKQQKELEYQILQSQINPHFLYNTLNSIKWMATIQHASGIPEMTTALSRLLKSISKGTRQLIPLREELDLLKNYVLIQEYRYGGVVTVSYEIEKEELLSYVIPKFTLQPIVENAIFHGIEPKGANGTILISIRNFEKNLKIEIIDNGIGMSKELIADVLSGEDPSPNDFFRKIGIHNVHRRIQYTFGESYGLSIESEVGSFTKMCILIPCKKEDEQNDKTINRG